MKKTNTIFLIAILLSTVVATSGFQLFKTSLRVTVLNELGNIEVKAKVVLYKTEEDYKNNQNPVREGKTDKKGIVTFQELEVLPYYISASNGDRDNLGAGEKTELIDEGKLNRITVIISE
jgi:hypothetical protein